jgi:hypothetical protein
MALPVSFFTATLADNTLKSNGTPETTSWSVPVTTLTAANYTAQSANIDALETAVMALVIGALQTRQTVIDRRLVSAQPAPSSLAQRENKMLLRYHSVTTSQKFQVSIGTFDLTKLMPNSEFVDLSTGLGGALKTAFQAIVVSPDNSGDTVILDSVQFVGRNT